MAVERSLDTYWDGRLVGRFLEQASFLVAFEYVPGYEGFPISASMPVQQAPHSGRVAYDFLANLLPESDRDRLARQERLDPGDSFGLIGALGRECAGALQIVPAGESPELPPPAYEPLTEVALSNWLQTRATQPLLMDHQRRIRLSLAGAQAKAALYFADEQSPQVPLHGAVTSHIVKPSIPQQRPNTAHIEYLCMQLGRVVLGESEVPSSSLWRNHYRVRRYDRPEVDGRLVRIHQEDFCQALRENVKRKYEDADHPPVSSYLARAMALLDQLGDQGLIHSPAVERNRLLDRVVFNVLIHNADAHLKNYGLLYRVGQGITVAPLYDAVCTSGIVMTEGELGAYSNDPRREVSISTDMGLRIGEVFDIRAVTGNDWTRFARQCGLTPRLVLGAVRSISDSVIAAIENVGVAIVEAYPSAEHSVEQTAPLIRAQTLRILKQLAD